MNIGEKVKELRTKNKLTLKRMSELTGLSTGFLSQFERGITTIDVIHLNNIAKILNVEIGFFFDSEKPKEELIVRGYSQPITHTMNHVIYKSLSREPEDKMMSPKLIEILPAENKERPSNYRHMGEEFIYVLEGILTLFMGDDVYKMYPGDSVHFQSSQLHNWGNLSDNIVKFIIVHYPNDEKAREKTD